MADAIAAAPGAHYHDRMPVSRRARISAHENALTRALRDHRTQRRSWVDLTCSNPTQCGLVHDPERLAEALGAAPPVHYAPSPLGDPAARRELCAYLRTQGVVDANPAHTLLTSSTSEAYGLLFKLLCDPGDAVLAPAPSYPLFERLAALEGVQLLPYPLRYDGRWHIDLPALRQAARHDRVRAVLVVSPNNPTGNRVTHAELSALASLQLPVISDEVFAEYALHASPEAATSALQLAPETLVFRMGGLSKSALLPQAKLAWTTLAGPAGPLADAVDALEHLADTYLSPSAFIQACAADLLRAASPLVSRLRQRLAHNLERLQQAASGAAFDALHVEAGWIATVRLPAIMDDEAWALALLEQGVQVQPGHFYDLDASPPHVMLSLLTPEAQFERGLDALRRGVEHECG